MEQILTKSKQTSISTTDKEVLWMLNKKGVTDFNYNIQSVNDTNTGIIINNRYKINTRPYRFKLINT